MSFPAAPKNSPTLPLSEDEIAKRDHKLQIYTVARNRAFEILFIDIVRRFTDTNKNIVPHEQLQQALLDKWQDKRIESDSISPSTRNKMQISTTANWARRKDDDLLSQEFDIERPTYFCTIDQINKNIIFTPTSILTRHRTEFRNYISSNGFIPSEITLLIFDVTKNHNGSKLRVDYAFRFIFSLSKEHDICPDWDN
jgi:hypothetical protein